MSDQKQIAMRARGKLRTEVLGGRIIPSTTCEKCGKACPKDKPWKIHGHHDDYAKPLEVRWLCASCHMKLHAKQGVRHGHPTYGKQKTWPRLVIPMPPELLAKLDRLWHQRMLRNRASTIHTLIAEASDK